MLGVDEASAQPAFVSGLRRSAFLAADGRRTPIGTRSKELQFTGLDSTARRCAPSHRGRWSCGVLEPKITVVPRVLSLVLCPTPHKGSDRRRPFLGL